MESEKSLTGRTTASVEVGERGAVKVLVFREGLCVHEFSVNDEPDLPKSGVIELRKGGKYVDVFVDGNRSESIKVV